MEECALLFQRQTDLLLLNRLCGRSVLEPHNRFRSGNWLTYTPKLTKQPSIPAPGLAYNLFIVSCSVQDIPILFRNVSPQPVLHILIPPPAANDRTLHNMANALTQEHIALLTWHSLVSRSIKAWDSLLPSAHTAKPLHAAILQKYSTLDDFLDQMSGFGFHFWFVQLRSAFLRQSKIPKWSPDRLSEYILLPASPGFVSRHDVFFASHYWTRPDNPDPDGTYLRFVQHQLAPQEWSYIWVDWTCAPQAPRTVAEEKYFRKTLGMMSGLVRNSGFMYYYESWRPRLWVLYEIAEYLLTTSDSHGAETKDIQVFVQHVCEMKDSNVEDVIEKYGYSCGVAGDRVFLLAWLEFLVLLHKLRLGLDKIRSIMDLLTWQPTVEVAREATPAGWLELRKFEGRLVYCGQEYCFTPFPHWVGENSLEVDVC
ncbi:hypothetical protein PMIN05_007345 [Paraphaeosphaeria minitans]